MSMDVVWPIFALVYLGMLSMVLYLLRKQRLAFEEEKRRRDRTMSALLQDPMNPRGDSTIRKGDTLWEVLAAAQQAEEGGFVMMDDEGDLVVSVEYEQGMEKRDGHHHGEYEQDGERQDGHYHG